ncbi:MAG: RNA pseudouridine synthase [Acidovorax sp.]|uniref:RNA pseudouridine synthase n=1 Tax=Acidovorax sp. TaxID=1872122 RepID=UPI0039E38CA3
MTEADNAVRLAKRLAAERGCSRREAELLIDNGAVRVDGVLAESPAQRVLPAQRIEVAPNAQAREAPPVTLLLHKPAGCTATQALRLLRPETHAGDLGPPVRILPRHFRHLAPCTPLPDAASGLMVFTQDPRALRHFDERPTLEHECLADVDGTAAPDALARAAQAHRAKLSWQSEQRLRIALQGPHLHAVHALCQSLGLALRHLRLLRIGRVPLAKLPEGQWRYLQPWERF